MGSVYTIGRCKFCNFKGPETAIRTDATQCAWKEPNNEVHKARAGKDLSQGHLDEFVCRALHPGSPECLWGAYFSDKHGAHYSGSNIN